MAGDEDIYKEVSVSIVELGEATDANQRHSDLLYWLGGNHKALFSKGEATNKNYVVAFWSRTNNRTKPKVQFFGRKSQVKKFLRANIEAVFDYRYSDEMEFLL